MPTGVAASTRSWEDLEEFDDVMTNWAHYLEVSGWHKSRQPSLRFICGGDTPNHYCRTHGTIIESKSSPQYSLCMESPSNGTTLDDFIPILERHPLLAIGSGLRVAKGSGAHLSSYKK